jgi:dolichyl-phosphate beta-glucosyltransferase
MPDGLSRTNRDLVSDPIHADSIKSTSLLGEARLPNESLLSIESTPKSNAHILNLASNSNLDSAVSVSVKALPVSDSLERKVADNERDAFDAIRATFDISTRLQRLAIVIPMYKEQNRIAATIEVLAASGLHRDDVSFCFVDDGSPDRTVSVTEDAITKFSLLNARVVRLRKNAGKGAAVRAGVLAVVDEAEVVGFLDADLSLDPSEVMTALTRMDLAKTDVLVGERIVDVDSQPKIRRVSSLVFRSLTARLVTTGVKDPQCAMKLFRSPVAKRLFADLETDGFAFDVELLARLKRDRFVVTQVPVLWEHQPGSQINTVTDSFRMIREVLKIRAILR